LNALTGAITANAAIVPAGNGGAIDLYADAATDIAVDVNGYFAVPGPGGLSLYTQAPCRVLDTRRPEGGPRVTGLRELNPAVSGCGLAGGLPAYVVNMTAVPSGFLGYVTLWPQGEAQPTVSTLNALDGAVTSNMAIVRAGNSVVTAFASGTTDLIFDVLGFFAP
jgi:hypothetical protein